MIINSEQEKLALLLIDGALSVFDNAAQLYAEASILATAGAFPRAYLLHQISLEECGKIEILGAAIISCLCGVEVNTKSLAKVFRRHEAKNKINAYFLPRSEEELAAEEMDDLAGSSKAFKAIQQEFHDESNRLKNASLYVDFDEVFSAPKDVITQADYEKIRAQNGEFMALTDVKIKMLARWRKDIAQAAADVNKMQGLLTETKDEGVSLAEARELIWERVKTAFKPGKE
ncbi:AbiV family abortive infection protein [Pseudomonas pudica]|uniref:AbiV family abortive infection protein n=1 Tax=Pseudomonas TaxID=286 RepID=UPI001302D8B0|nr:AbiV family abortive infection protein [Pseudomonas sp. B10(2017)]